MEFIQNLFRKSKKYDDIIVVSGLPRSGTSMMMRMLDMGGLPPIVDNIRKPDQDNPKGYYEFEKVKELDKGVVDWLPDASGKAVKVISSLLFYLPNSFQYKIVFMRRSLPEILASQKRMLDNREVKDEVVKEELISKRYLAHLKRIDKWMLRQHNIKHIYVSYNDLLLETTTNLEKIKVFLPCNLDIEKMATIIDPSLYRQRQK